MKHSSTQNKAAQTLPKLIIFDFDGTLVETEVLFTEIISDKLAKQGLYLEPAQIATSLSGGARERDKLLLEELLGEKLQDCFMDEVRAAVRAAVAKGLATTPGALEMLRWLPIPFCIASNASRSDLILRMRAAGLFEYIGSRFFSSDDVNLRKPDPSVFLLAAEAMGVAPRDCLVLEDSVSGLEAARRAHMRSCAFVGARHHTAQIRSELKDYSPEALFFDYKELRQFLVEEGL